MAGTDPPPFVKFRSRQVEEASVYELALDLTGTVDALLENTEAARFYLKSKLDRNVTNVALWLGQAGSAVVTSERKSLYHRARPLVVEVGTILDILGRRAGVDKELVGKARELVRCILERLEHLSAY